ncbi:LAMI_0B01464g1_1 [Lachancea mirantina]|uniref:LAMI_0B01464g1_1 n=1 Tax=Lachancea mirantina TaxID=1230905 RepID=A0A1G4IU86_9SACH|nr:LAMI_0B01464g1_1 [Lachancea mirantina]
MKLAFTLFFTVVNSLAVSVINTDDYQEWALSNPNNTYENVVEPIESCNVVTLESVDENENVVDTFQLELDGDALEWWSEQTNSLIPANDSNYTTSIDQTLQPQPTSLSTTAVSGVNSSLFKRLPATIKNCGWFCGLSYHCRGALTACKNCRGFGKRWLKHCVLSW